MQMYLEGIYGGIGQGLLFTLVAIGIFLTFRVLKSPDLTLEGSFAFGGAVAMVMLNSGIHFGFVLGLAPLGGALAGLLTGLIHTKLKIDMIVSGLLMTMSLFSVKLFVMDGPNQSAPLSSFVFTPVSEALVSLGLSPWISHLSAFVVVGTIVVSIVIIVLHFLFKTSFGLSLRATGSNSLMSQANGVNTDNTKIALLVIANSLIALSGVLVVQHQAGASVTTGNGILVIGLGALVLGESFTPKNSGILGKLVFVALGSMLYFSIITVVILSGLVSTNATRLLQALLALFALALPKLRYSLAFQRLNKKRIQKIATQGGRTS